MKRPRSVIAATALAATAIAMAAAGSAGQASAAGLPAGPATPGGPAGSGTTTLPDSVAPFATASRAMGSVPAANKLTLQFWLAPRTAAAENYATAASTPGNPLYRHFLSPAAYTSRFGATDQSAASVESWLRSAGFTGLAANSGRDYVRATAPVATIAKALKVQLQYYRPPAG